MTNIITGGTPSGNSRASTTSAIFDAADPHQEAIWAAQLEACRTRRIINVRPVTGVGLNWGFDKKIPAWDTAAGIDWVDYETGEVSNGAIPDIAWDIKMMLSTNGVYLPEGYTKQFEHLADWSDTRLVTEITIGEQDVVISNTLRGGREQQGGGIRGKVVEWSKASRARCEKHIRNVKSDSIKFFLTLTYPKSFTNDGIAVKRDLFAMRKRLVRMGVDGGIWFLEFQKRGAPHFHIFLNKWPEGGNKAVAKAWHEVVGSDDPNHLAWHEGTLGGGNRPCLEKMRKPHAASYYASKYACKAEQKDVPEQYTNVGRFWGYWGDMKPEYAVYYSHGTDGAVRAIKIIRWWKTIKFGGHVGDGLLLYTATLRGCSNDDFLLGAMSLSGWCPDG